MVGISVIMPVYNVSNYLQNSIDSIKNQTFEDIEIICVNDGSTDNSVELLNSISQEFPDFKIVTQENSGPGIARNVGIDHAEGEYIAFLDADDIFLDDDALEKMYEVAKNNDADLVCGNLKWINQDYTLNDRYDFVNTGYAYSDKYSVLTTREYGIPFAFYKNIFKRELLEKNNIRFPDMRTGEDPIFMTKVLTSTDKCYMVPVDLYGYNHSIGGGVNEKIDSYEKKYSYINHFKEVFDIFLENGYENNLSLYKNEFIHYYITYSDNLQDEDILSIVRRLFDNFGTYFDKDDYGYFIMDYIVNQESDESSEELAEYRTIKKCLFEEASIHTNNIDVVELRKYHELMDEDRYSANQNNLKKASFDELNRIKTSTHTNRLRYAEEVDELRHDLTVDYYDKNAEFLRKYSEARFDIKNYGGEDHDVILLSYDDPFALYSKPSWFTNEEGIGTVIDSTSGEIEFNVQCVEDGILVLTFKGIDYRDKYDNRIPIYIDFTEIIVDGVNIIHGSTVSWHDNPITYEKEVQDGQVINVRAKWYPLSYKSNFRVLNNFNELEDIVTKGRIDIKNVGTSSNNVVVENIDEELNCQIEHPEWFLDEEGQGAVVESNDFKVDLSLQCEGDGKLLVEFRSMDYRDGNDNRIPVLIKYDEILIDDEYFVNEEWIVWHDDPIIYEKDVKDGETINIKASWTLFNNNFYEVDDLFEEKYALVRENNELRKFKETVLQSNSWKLTSPLRMIKSLKK